VILSFRIKSNNHCWGAVLLSSPSKVQIDGVFVVVITLLCVHSLTTYFFLFSLQAKLAGVPIYPSYVIGGLFLGILVGLLLLMVLPSVSVIDWF